MFKKNLWNPILKKWYVFLLWVLISFGFCNALFTMVTATNRDEKISFFIASYNVKRSLLETLNDNKPELIKKVEVYWLNPEHEEFNMYFSAYGLINADIIILPESKITKLDLPSCFAAFPNGIFSDSVLYTETDGNNFGVRVYNKETGEGCAMEFIAYTHEEEGEDYYLFFNKNSEHNQFLDNKESVALQMAKKFMEL